MTMEALRHALYTVEQVINLGDDKHGVDAWLNNPRISDPTAEALSHVEGAKRHVMRRLRGDLIDESGFPAMAHVAARALIALQLEINMFSIQPEKKPEEYSTIYALVRETGDSMVHIAHEMSKYMASGSLLCGKLFDAGMTIELFANRTRPTLATPLPPNSCTLCVQEWKKLVGPTEEEKQQIWIRDNAT